MNKNPIEQQLAESIWHYFEKRPEMIPPISTPEKEKGIEYGNIMLKPEAMTARSDKELFQGTVEMILELCEQYNLEIIATFVDILPIEVVREIYSKEIASSVIPEFELARFAENQTGHIILKGRLATAILAGIKGRFVCNDDSSCFKRMATKYNLPAECINPPGYKPSTENRKGEWASGCGIRGMLAAKGIIVKDPAEDRNTIFNWIHAPDPGEEKSVLPLINRYNKSPKKFDFLLPEG